MKVAPRKATLSHRALTPDEPFLAKTGLSEPISLTADTQQEGQNGYTVACGESLYIEAGCDRASKSLASGEINKNRSARANSRGLHLVSRFVQRLVAIPWSRQEYSGTLTRQPSPLRYDPYGAMGLTPLLGLPDFLASEHLQSFAGVVFVAFVSFLYSVLILRCTQEYAIFANFASRETHKEGVAMTVAFESIAEIDEQVSQIEKKNRASSEHLEQISKLEKQFQTHSEPAEIADEINQIKCTVHEANEITQRRDFYLLSKKVEQVISEIERFHQLYQEPLPDKVFSDLRSNLETHQRSLDYLKKALKLPGSKNGKNLSRTVTKLEKIAFGLKGNLELFPYHVIQMIDSGYREILEQIKQEGFEATKGKGEPFVPGIKKFEVQLIQRLESIVKLTEKAKAYVISTQSAEAKAIERLESLDSIEWETALEPEQEINIEAMNAWLEKRGYKTQVPCEDTSSG